MKAKYLISLLDMELTLGDIVKYIRGREYMENILIAYYSRRGNNYVNGEIKYLETGNTEIVAEMIRKLTNADMVKIETVKTYPEYYHEATNLAQYELKNNIYPEIIKNIDSIKKYDVIFIGYPNWWGTMPMPVFTFIDRFKFDDKLIIPFCTHEGSGFGNSINDLKKVCIGAKIEKGLSLIGNKVNKKETEEKVRTWIKDLNISNNEDGD